MKHSTLRASIDAARREQRVLINQASAVQDTPSDGWLRRIANLEARIFALEAMEAAQKQRLKP